MRKDVVLECRALEDVHLVDAAAVRLRVLDGDRYTDSALEDLEAHFGELFDHLGGKGPRELGDTAIERNEDGGGTNPCNIIGIGYRAEELEGLLDGLGAEPVGGSRDDEMGGGNGGGNRRESHARLGVDNDGIEAVLRDGRLYCARQRVLIDLVTLEVPLVCDVC